MSAQNSPNDDEELSVAGRAEAGADVRRERHREAGATLPTRRVPLGEELPIFCERCGYCLHGMAQQVCERCTIRQFHCPECGHHQPINTLRPAAQKILGRVRAVFLTLSVIFKLNFFGWLLFAWVAMGYEWSYEYSRVQSYAAGPAAGLYRQNRPVLVPREMDVEQMSAFIMFGGLFGMSARMLLLRWRRGYKVGLVLSALVGAAVVSGAVWRKMEREGRDSVQLPQPFAPDFLLSIASAILALTLGASIVWGIWSALAHVFLPRRTSDALLDWQRSQSSPSAAVLGRD
jgi:hypothetical protein